MPKHTHTHKMDAKRCMDNGYWTAGAGNVPTSALIVKDLDGKQTIAAQANKARIHV